MWADTDHQGCVEVGAPNPAFRPWGADRYASIAVARARIAVARARAPGWQTTCVTKGLPLPRRAHEKTPPKRGHSKELVAVDPIVRAQARFLRPTTPRAAIPPIRSGSAAGTGITAVEKLAEMPTGPVLTASQ